MRLTCPEPDAELVAKAQQWIIQTATAERISVRAAESRLLELLLYEGLPLGLRETP